MAINKIVDRQGQTIIDLSTDNVSPSRVLRGTTFHGPDGAVHTGTLIPTELEPSQYNFIDYDGTILYSYTDEELDLLSELPAGPDHTGDNLTFQEWNWTLADLKAWDRTRPDRPIVGANLITTDGKSYLYMDTPYSGATLSFSTYGTLNSVDWGDGTINTSTSHIYTNPGQYTIVIDMAEGGYWYFSSSSTTESENRQWIKRVKLGNITTIRQSAFYNCYSLQSISIPNSVTRIVDSAFYYCSSLQNIIIPNGVTTLNNSAFYGCTSLQSISIPNSLTQLIGSIFYYCYQLQNIIIPNGVTTIGASAFYNCYSLQNIIIPNGITQINSSTFNGCNTLTNLKIPNSVTSIAGAAFANCTSLTLDLSQQTKVITLADDIRLNTLRNKILVPSSLLEQYKSSSYWSSYASIIVGA